MAGHPVEITAPLEHGHAAETTRRIGGTRQNFLLRSVSHRRCRAGSERELITSSSNDSSGRDLINRLDPDPEPCQTCDGTGNEP